MFACLHVRIEQVMDGVAAVPDETNEEYKQFFRELGLADHQRTTYLARLLERFFEVGAKLDEYLAPTGAVLHAAVSRMCAGENPMDPPHHRWIRVHDRLGFFADQDEHASRIVNTGLTFAYRHKELEALSAVSELRLEQFRLNKTRSQVPASTSAEEVPDGGRVVRNDRAVAAVDGVHGVGSARGAGAGDELYPDDKDSGHGGGVTVPIGGLHIRRDPPAGAAAGAAPTDGGGDDVPAIGGTVVERRPTHVPPAHPGGTAEALMVTGPVAGPVRLKEQPVVIPSPQAVTCTSAVLESCLSRSDAKGVVRQLLVDGLLCWGRLHSGQTAKAAAGLISAADVATEWPAVRKLLADCWPTWSSPVSNVAALPPEGSVSRQTHPGRTMLTSRWKVKVDMTATNPTIRRLEVASDRHFKKGPLDAFVEVQRIAPVTKVPLAVTIASILLVATWDSAFCTIMQQLAASGRAPVNRKSSIADAACHDFESAGLRQRQALGATIGAEADTATDGDTAELPTTATPLAAVVEERQAEVDHLLAVDKADTAGANRAQRILARRRDRAPARLEQPPTAGETLVPGSSPATASATRPRKRPTPREAKGGTRKKAAVQLATGGPADGGGLSISQVTAAPFSIIHDAPPVALVQHSNVTGVVGAQPVSSLSSPGAVRSLPDGEQTLPVSPKCLSLSTPVGPVPSLALSPPIASTVGSLSDPGAQPSGSGTPPLSLSRLPRSGGMQRVAASLRTATKIADALVAVRFPSAAPLPSAPVANPSSALGAPFDSDSDAEVAMMDEEEEDEADADA